MVWKKKLYTDKLINGLFTIISKHWIYLLRHTENKMLQCHWKCEVQNDIKNKINLLVSYYGFPSSYFYLNLEEVWHWKTIFVFIMNYFFIVFLGRIVAPKLLNILLWTLPNFSFLLIAILKVHRHLLTDFFFFFLMGHGITQVNLLRYIERPNKNEKNK